MISTSFGVDGLEGGAWLLSDFHLVRNKQCSRTNAWQKSAVIFHKRYVDLLHLVEGYLVMKVLNLEKESERLALFICPVWSVAVLLHSRSWAFSASEVSHARVLVPV